MKKYSVGFTGHRPNKLSGGYDMNSAQNKYLGNIVEIYVEKLIIEKGVYKCYSGGALGFDQIAFLAVNNLKVKYQNLENILCVPFITQDNNWFDASKKIYNYIKEIADDIVYVDRLEDYRISNIPVDRYHPAKMQKRNEYMVDNSQYIIGAWDGSKGGTRNCLMYAEELKRNIFLIDKKFL